MRILSSTSAESRLAIVIVASLLLVSLVLVFEARGWLGPSSTPARSIAHAQKSDIADVNHTEHSPLISLVSGDSARATESRSSQGSLEEQLARLDGNREAQLYATVLTSLIEKCYQSRSQVAAAVIGAQQALARERGILVSVLDYLHGVGRTAASGRGNVDCAAVALELGRAL